MLDLETMGNTPQAPIVAIGAIEFTPGRAELGRGFYARIDLEDSARFGAMDASTVLWWMQQEDAARRELYAGDRLLLAPALAEFSRWLESCEGGASSVGVWGNGAAFDNVILRNAYARTSLPTPWKVWQDKCYRTVRGLYPETPQPARLGVHHNALDDAKHQARHLLAIFNSKE